MLHTVRSKLTYPYVVSTLALFVALGGGAYALDGKNGVNSGDVKNNTLTSKDQKNGKGTKGVDVADNSLKGADVDESSLSQVPSAANANHANSAGSADVAGAVLTKVGPGDPGVQSPASTGFFNVVSLGVPAGKYVLLGKASIDNDDPAAIDQLDCRILVGSIEDRVIDALEVQTAVDDDTDTIALNLPVSLGAAGNANLQCNNPAGGAGDLEVHYGRITALPVSSVTTVAFP